MLIEFSVTNFRSIRETQTLSMAASKYYKEQLQQNSFETGVSKLPRLLRSAVIYGPNASGKSNLVLALSFMKNLVISSAKQSQEGEEIDVEPFRLDSSCVDKDSEFEIFFVEDGIRYQYGFAVNKFRVVREWMIAYPKGRPQHWFSREYDTASCKDIYEFGELFLGGRRRDDWSLNTRGNALFLSTAIQLNNEQLKRPFHWFRERLQILEPHSMLSPNFTAKQCENEETKRKIVNFLNTADLGIADLSLEKRKFSVDEIPGEIPIEIKEQIKKDFEGRELLEIKFVHKLIDKDEYISFEPDAESQGTKNLFSFAGPWLDVIDNDLVLVVDELDTSLHPLIVHNLIRLLHHDNSNKSQIVFTTHDTSILSQHIMRRDQIWFVEKTQKLSTKLYAFSDFNVREKDAWEKAYLNGRYGAIPFIRNVYSHGN